MRRLPTHHQGAERSPADERAGDQVVVAGIGNELRGDDGVGPAVVRRFLEGMHGACGSSSPCRVVSLSAPLGLLGEWDGAILAVVVDATRSGLAPGTVSVLEVTPERDGAAVGSAPQSSTHGLGVVEALRLSRATGRAPSLTIVVGIEGEDFGLGSGLSPSVEAVLDDATACVADVVGAATRGRVPVAAGSRGLRPRAPRR